jgi:hypothetical protein
MLGIRESRILVQTIVTDISSCLQNQGFLRPVQSRDQTFYLLHILSLYYYSPGNQPPYECDSVAVTCDSDCECASLRGEVTAHPCDEFQFQLFVELELRHLDLGPLATP